MHSLANGSIGILGISTRATERIHTVINLEILHEIKALSEAWKILRERQRIPTKLPEPRRRNCYEIHLHVVQSYEHSLCQRGAVEQTFQIIHGACRKPEKWIHKVVLRAQSNDLLAL